MNNIFDSHAHYDDSAFDEDRFELLDSLFQNGLTGFVNCGSDLVSSKNSIEIAQRYKNAFAALGVHPHEAQKASDDDLKEIETLLTSDPKSVAVGEIGLDYHYDFSPRDRQKYIFEYQLSLAKKLDLPVIIHDREAHEDTLVLLKKYKPRGVVHCFSGSAEMAKDVLSLGMYIGLGGAVTFKNAKKPVQVAKIVPENRLLIETDCPYMTPVPFRGRRNDSGYIPYTAQILAEIRGMEPQQILDITLNNALELFRIQL
ncbi:MAG: TatD family hydrolase [Clostridia bacterium]|nr:TatD family hydrolase [Clostridia bacterium]